MLTTEFQKKFKSLLQDHADLRDAVIQLEESHAGIVKSVQDTVRRAHFRGAKHEDFWDGRKVFEDPELARGFGLFVMSLTHESMKQRQLCTEEMDSVTRDMASDPDSAGGALIGHEFSMRMKRMLELRGVFRRNAFPMPMTMGELTFLKQVGEVVVYLLSENAAGTSSDASFSNVTLHAKQWGTLTYYPVTLGMDAAVAVGELVARSIVDAMALKEDNIGFLGDGTSNYFGIKGIIPKLIDLNGVDEGGSIILGSGNLMSEFVLNDFEKVAGQLPEYPGINPKWYCSRWFYYNVMIKLLLASGGVTASEIEGKRERMFLGDPVEITQVMPKTDANSQIACLYGDLRYAATVGDRQQMTIESSAGYKFAERQITVLGTQRVAISVEDLGDATNAGPVIGLMSQSS